MIVHPIRDAARTGVRAACIVSLDDLKIDARIGALGDEHGRLQPLIITVEAEIAPPASDRLDETLDYRFIAEAARRLAKNHIVLIETFASRLGDACLSQPGVDSVNITVRKPQAVPGALAGATVHARKGIRMNRSERAQS